MNYITFEKEMIQKFYGLSPQEVYGQSNTTNYFYKRYLYNKIYSGYDIKLLSGWALNVFRYCLFHFGSIAIFKYNGGWTYGAWSPAEWNNQMQPVKIYCHTLLENPAVMNKTKYTVGKDAIIVKCFDDFLGWDDLVCETSELMANCTKTTNIALMNANVNLVATVKSDKQKTQIETAYAQGTEGKPCIFIDEEDAKTLSGEKDELMRPWTNHDTIGAMDRILICRRTILNNFLTEIGIKNANTQKKERLISDEVNQNNEETSANINICYNNIKEAFDQFNDISGLTEKITVDLHYDYETEGDDLMNVSEVIENE